MRRALLTGWLAAVLALVPRVASGLDTETIVERNESAAVVIWGTNPATGKQLQGSGCCVDLSGYVLTVAHQVAGLETFRARLRDGTERDLALVDVDEEREIALLKSSAPMPTAARIGDATSLRSGSDLVAIAAPLGLEWSAVPGTVSSVNRIFRNHPIIQATIAASPGSSGGPVFDRRGELIGLIVSRLEQEESIKMVVPINNAYPMLRAHGITIPGEARLPAESEIIPAKNVTQDELRAIRAYNHGVMSDSPDEKVKLYQQAVGELAGFFEAWFNLGVAYAALDDLSRAGDAYLNASRLRPDSAEVQRNLGRVFLRQQALQEATACFERARTLAPRDPSSHNDLGYAYLQSKQLKKAENCFLTALQLKPDYSLARYNLALTYAAAGRASQAIEQFEQYLDAAPDANDAAEVRAMIARLKSG